MTEESDLIKLICTNPHDDAPRKIYADWLDDHGKHDQAEFIRVQIESEPLYRLENQWVRGQHKFDEFHMKCINCGASMRELLLGGTLSRFCFGENRPAYERTNELRKREAELFWIVGPQYQNVFPTLRVVDCIASFNGSLADIGNVLLSRGLPSQIALSMSVFVGGQCQQCEFVESSGYAHRDFSSHASGTCYLCKGAKRISGIAKDVFEKWPITKVTISDAVIHPSGGNDTYYLGGLGSFPSHYWHRLENRLSRTDVNNALSNVCVDYGRELAGLPPLNPPGTKS